MKLKSLVCSFMLSLLPLLCYGERTGSIVVYLSEDHDPTEMDPDPTKKRSGGLRLPCEITLDGISISGTNSSEINMYDVLDTNGVVLASFESEQEFISYLFTVEETVKIRFCIDGFTLSGFLYM